MDKKRKAYHFGLWGEVAAILMLYLKGYHIIGRRMRNYAGEIDLIAKRGNTLAFIEVKTRKILDNPGDVLTYHQQQRITRAASLFVAKHRRYADANLRFDLVLVRPFRLPEHIENAW